MKRISFLYPKRMLVFLAMAGILIFTGLASQAAWAGTTLTADAVREKAHDFLLSHLSWDPERMDIQIQYKGEDVRLPTDQYQLDFRLTGSKNRIGRFPFILNIKMDNRPPIRVPLMAQVEVTYDVLQMRHPVKRGEILNESDLEWNQIKSKRILRQVVTELDDAVGYRMTRNLDQGEILSPHMLKPVPLIKQGDQVILVAEKGPLTVRAPGLARQNGFKNESVMIKNIQSGKIVIGTVIDSRTVRVDF